MSGQLLGSYIEDDLYDLEVAVKLSDLDYVSVGDEAELLSPVTGLKLLGEVDRINSTVDQSTQTVSVYLRVSGDGIKDNMFFEGKINTTHHFYGIEIPRKILQNEFVFSVDENNLIQKSALTVYQKYDDKAIVGGLVDGTKIVDRTSGIYQGLEVITDDEEAIAPEKAQGMSDEEAPARGPQHK